MINLVEKLIPKKGFLWRIIPGTLQNLLAALNEEPKRIRDFLNSVVREANSGTAIDTQEDWYQQYGLIYKDTKSLEEKQSETLERYIALGDQDITYLQDQVNKAGFTGITLLENVPPLIEEMNECGAAECGAARCWSGGAFGSDWIFYYFVNGEVDTDEELSRLKTLLQKLAPSHLVPDYGVSSSDNVCGPAECGEVVCDG